MTSNRALAPGFLVAWLLFIGSSSDVTAQEAPPASPPASSGRASQRIEIDELKFVGKIVKPQVQFIISREKGISDETLEPRASFLSKVTDAVQEAPF